MSETLTPVFRLEYFIAAAANGTPCDLEPVFNEEKYLHAIAGAEVELPMPIGRTQEYLAKLAGMDVEIPDHPIFRTEFYLAHMIDSTIECPAPIYREEMFWYDWAAQDYVTVTGNPVSFSAKAAPLRQLSVAFSPVQSLNGYDAPWPAGGGKNKFDPSAFTWKKWHLQSNVFETLLDSDPAISFTVNGSESVSITNTLSYYGIGVVVNAVDYDRTASLKESVGGAIQFWGAYEDGATRISTGSTSCLIPANTSGFLAIRKDNTEAKTAFVQVELGSSASAWTPYSNICPISGWSSLTVEQRGKNLLPNDISAYSENDAYYYIPAIMPLDTLAVMSLSDRDTSVDISGCYIGFIGDYNGIGSPTKYKWVINNGTVSADKTNVEQTSTRTGKCEGIFIYPENTETFNKLFSRFNIQVEIGETATAYVPYNPLSRSISISLGQTVYSGWVDVVTGVLTVDKTKMTFSREVTIGLNEQDANTTRIGMLLPNARRVSLAERNQFICDMGAYSASATAENAQIGNCTLYTVTAGVYFMFHAPKFPTYDEAFAYLIENECSVVYELATPITIQLTPQEVQSLLGVNNMWASSNGDMTVTYRSN